jgi:hypothetical protein
VAKQDTTKKVVCQKIDAGKAVLAKEMSKGHGLWIAY